MLAAIDTVTGKVTMTFDGTARLSLSKSRKSVVVCKVLRPERVPGTEISYTFTAYIPLDIAKAEGIDIAKLSIEADAADAAAKVKLAKAAK